MHDETGGTGVGLVEAYDLSPTSDSKLANISTRGFVGTLDDVMIGGFIISGGGARVVVRAIGPSLGTKGISNPLADPTLDLHDANGALVTTNNNWEDSQALDLQAVALAPSDLSEAATVQWLSPGAYTAVAQGNSGQTGVGLVDIYCVN
jgi:hypothetical protein